jgi:hypothetical protein
MQRGGHFLLDLLVILLLLLLLFRLLAGGVGLSGSQV